MKFVFASYVKTPGFKTPTSWLYRIRAYAGIHKALGIYHEVACVEQINYEGLYSGEGIHYHFLQLPTADKYLPKRLHRFIKQQSPDIVLIHGLHFPLQVIQLRLALGFKVKIIIQHHAERPFNGIKKYLQRCADQFVDAYLFASMEMGLDWVKRGNLRTAHKINEVMELSSVFGPMEQQTARLTTGVEGGPVFLWVGRLNQNKDPLMVVRAFLKFAERQPHVRLYMIYHTDELLTNIQELLKDHAGIVTLVGQVPHEQLLYWYNSADFIISGSHYEGSGTAICEAMTCGCIPIVTDIPSFRMITNHGKCGMLYEARNETALLNALLQTSQVDILQQQQQCMDYFTSNLSFEAIAQRIAAIAESLAK